jgi:transposase-like protein
MKKFGLILEAVSQVVAAVALVLSYRKLVAEVEQARRLQSQMEEDHARLVRNVIHAEHAMFKMESRQNPDLGMPSEVSAAFVACTFCGRDKAVLIGVDMAQKANVYECQECGSTWENEFGSDPNSVTAAYPSKVARENASVSPKVGPVGVPEGGDSGE